MNPLLPLLLAAAVAAPQTTSTPVAQLTWTPCALADEDIERRAECALVPLPLDHEDPSAGMIGIAVKRVRAEPGSDAPTRLWFLDGGPGDSGIHSLPRVHELLGDIGIDLYTLDHRGVGRSAELSCPEQEAESSPGAREILEDEWPACMQHLRDARPDLPYLSTSQAAADLGALIDLTEQDATRVVVFGASYGTYWAQRYLEAYPDQASALILDGLVPPGWNFAEFDDGIDAMARRLMQACAELPVCVDHLGEDPTAALAALPGRIDAGHCADLGIDGATVRLLFGNMLMGGQDIWPFIPPMAERLQQCRLRDMQAIGSLFEKLFEERGAGQEDPSHSPVLQRHVALSEMWPAPPPRAEDLQAALQTTLMTTAVSANFARTYDDWPRYPRPADLGTPAFTGPALLMHGELDPTMRPERLGLLVDAFGRPNQHYILLPGVGHVTLGKSDCANAIYRSFLADPAAPIDSSCASTPATNPLIMPADAPLLFETDDVWGEQMSQLELLINAALAGVLLLIGGGIWWWRRRRARVPSGRA